MLAVRGDLRLVAQLKGIEVGVHPEGVLRAEDRRDSGADLNDVRLCHRVDNVREDSLPQMQWHDDQNGRQYHNHQAEDQHPLHPVHLAGFWEEIEIKNKHYYLVLIS